MDGLTRQIFLVVIGCLSFARCEPALSTQYGVPGNYAGPGGSSHSGQGGNGFNDHYDGGNGVDDYYANQVPQSYEFGYTVKDAASDNDFGRQETSDGQTVRGQYRVKLPDGRTQVVDYTADWKTGFQAEVRYEGTATYPDDYNNGQGGNFGGNNGGNYNHGNGGFGGGNGYNNYRAGAGGNYNNGGNNYQYQFGSNSIDNSYNNLGSSRNYPGAPSPTYGPAYH